LPRQVEFNRVIAGVERGGTQEGSLSWLAFNSVGCHRDLSLESKITYSGAARARLDMLPNHSIRTHLLTPFVAHELTPPEGDEREELFAAIAIVGMDERSSVFQYAVLLTCHLDWFNPKTPKWHGGWCSELFSFDGARTPENGRNNCIFAFVMFSPRNASVRGEAALLSRMVRAKLSNRYLSLDFTGLHNIRGAPSIFQYRHSRCAVYQLTFPSCCLHRAVYGNPIPKMGRAEERDEVTCMPFHLRLVLCFNTYDTHAVPSTLQQTLANPSTIPVQLTLYLLRSLLIQVTGYRLVLSVLRRKGVELSSSRWHTLDTRWRWLRSSLLLLFKSPTIRRGKF
jgi:hypothetical protein